MRAITCIAALLLPCSVSIASAQPPTEITDPQLRRLNQPTVVEVIDEQQGQVYIYDGLREAQVNNALDTQFNRMDNMMFIRTVSTTPEGVEETSDDCDD